MSNVGALARVPWIRTAFIVVGLLAPMVHGQVSADEATARLQERIRQRHATTATSQASTQPANAQPQPQVPAAPVVPAVKGKSVVFIIDATGSMMTNLERIRPETIAAIEALLPADRFSVISIHSDQAAASSDALVAASPVAKKQASTFISKIQGYGTGDCIAAVTKAAKMSPDTIWLITDGDMGLPAAMLAQRIREICVPRKIRVNTTLAFCAEDNAAQSLLWRIAQDTGGVCSAPDGAVVEVQPGKPLKLPAQPTTKGSVPSK